MERKPLRWLPQGALVYDLRCSITSARTPQVGRPIDRGGTLFTHETRCYLSDKAFNPERLREGLPMAITSMTRIKSDNIEEVIKVGKQAKQIVEKHGAEFFRMSRFHTGPWIGEFLVVTRYSNWEAYGKAQDGMAKDPAWAKVLAATAKVGQFMGRNLTVSVDL